MARFVEKLVALLTGTARPVRDNGWSDRFLPPALCDAQGDRGRTNPVRDFCW